MSSSRAACRHLPASLHVGEGIGRPAASSLHADALTRRQDIREHHVVRHERAPPHALEFFFGASVNLHPFSSFSVTNRQHKGRKIRAGRWPVAHATHVDLGRGAQALAAPGWLVCTDCRPPCFPPLAEAWGPSLSLCMGLVKSAAMARTSFCNSRHRPFRSDSSHSLPSSDNG